MAKQKSATCPTCGKESVTRNNMHKEQWLCLHCDPPTRFIYHEPEPEPKATKAKVAAVPESNGERVGAALVAHAEAQMAEAEEGDDSATDGDMHMDIPKDEAPAEEHVVIAESPKARRSNRRKPAAVAPVEA